MVPLDQSFSEEYAGIFHFRLQKRKLLSSLKSLSIFSDLMYGLKTILIPPSLTIIMYIPPHPGYTPFYFPPLSSLYPFTFHPLFIFSLSSFVSHLFSFFSLALRISHLQKASTDIFPIPTVETGFCHTHAICPIHLCLTLLIICQTVYLYSGS